MTVQAAIAFATFLLENNHVLTLDERLDDLTHYLCAFNCGSAHLYSAFGVNQKNFVKFYCVALVHLGEVMNIQLPAGLGVELLSLNFYNCVHL